MTYDEIAGKNYQIVYRIAAQNTTSGTPEERYADITERLKGMRAATLAHKFDDAGHVATSTWVVRSTQARAIDLVSELKGRLTANIDILRVTEVVGDNFAEI
jgi:hypothetical protein